MDSFYKPLTPDQSQAAFRNEYDFDAPEAIDFDVLVEKLKDIKSGYDCSPARIRSPMLTSG
jgi:uridine kinase